MAQTPSFLEGTALEHVISRPAAAAAAEPMDDSDLIEPLPLNTEQRAAVKAALTRDFTVVTGPPGTGKSQVVSSIIINAAYRGQSVLFASRNNKAVDVVEARVNALSQRPSLLRLGRQHLGALAGYLTSLLAMPGGADAQSQHATAVAQLKAVDARIQHMEEAIDDAVELRNTVEALDATAEDARNQLPSDLVDDPVALDTHASEALLDLFEVSVTNADRSQQAWIVRAFWFALHGRREQIMEALLPDTAVLASDLGLDWPPTQIDPESVRSFVSEARKRLALLASLQKFDAAAMSFLQTERVEDLYRQRAGYVEERSSTSIIVWNTWIGAIRSGMTPKQQDDLGALNAVVKQLDGGRWSPTLAKRFQQLIISVKGFLPAWSITSLSVRGRIPLEPRIFDLVVIDEASQCDIASAIPLLYRARRAVIIGDPMQLRHISGLTVVADESIRSKYGLGAAPEWSYATESLYDLGARVGDTTIFLRDHHRSDRDIIEFSNREFYGGLLRIATRYDRLIRPVPPTAVRWLQVQGAFESPSGSGGLNVPEAETIVAELQRLEDQGYLGTIGVVTPFRAQANRIQQMTRSAVSERFYANADIDIGTAHTFQGDERDVMIYSTVISKGASRGALWFAGEANRNLFNVAITRARSALVVVGDRESEELMQIPIYKRFIRYIDSLAPDAQPELSEIEDLGERYPERLKASTVSMWEHDLYEALYRRGILTTPQVEVDAYRLDLALFDGDRKLDIEVDGEKYHAAWDGEHVYADRLRNMRMLELGWDVMRFWVWEVRDHLDGCVERVERWVEVGAGKR